MDRYLMYLRKSRADRDYSDEDTLERHRTRLNALCRARQLHVDETLQEISSADSIAGRPEMMRLLSLVETGAYAGVVCIDMDRLSRGSGADQALVINTFKYSGTKIITPQKDYDFSLETDEQFAELGLFLGRSEYRLIKRRLMQGRIDSAREGKYVAGNPPYGYATYKLQGQKGFSLRIVPEQAAVVRQIYDLYIDGNMGCRAIAAHLNTHGCRNQRGELWRDSHVFKILNDPVYEGKIRFRYRSHGQEMRNGQLVPVEHRNGENMVVSDGLHEAIIPPDRAAQVQQAKEKRRTPHVRLDRKMQNPLCSLVVCDQCGKRLILRAAKKKERPTLYCPTPGCPTKGAQIALIEERLLEALEDWLAGYEMPQQYVSRLPELQAQEKQAADDLAAAEKRMDRVAELLEQGVYSVDDYLKRKDNAAERIRLAQNRLQAVGREIAHVEAYESSLRDLAPSVNGVIEQYRSLPSAKEKNLLLKSVVDHIDYHKITAGRRYLHDFTLTVFPLIPKYPHDMT